MALNVASTEGPPTLSWMGRAVEFYHGVMREMRKVTWPDAPQVRDATLKIIIFVLVLALLITILDGILSALNGLVVSLVTR